MGLSPTKTLPAIIIIYKPHHRSENKPNAREFSWATSYTNLPSTATTSSGRKKHLTRSPLGAEQRKGHKTATRDALTEEREWLPRPDPLGHGHLKGLVESSLLLFQTNADLHARHHVLWTSHPHGMAVHHHVKLSSRRYPRRHSRHVHLRPMPHSARAPWKAVNRKGRVNNLHTLGHASEGLSTKSLYRDS